MRNDTHLFYSGILTTTANYEDNSFKLKLGSTRMVKIKNETGGTVQISFNGGNDDDADVLNGEILTLEHFQTSKIAAKGPAASGLRIWAY